MTKDKTVKNSRRKSTKKTENELYKLPKSMINEFIKAERRHDELDRLHEVTHQKKVWNRIFIACVLMNLVFVAFAIVGGFFIGK